VVTGYGPTCPITGNIMGFMEHYQDDDDVGTKVS